MDFHQLHAAPGRIFNLDSLLQRSNFYLPDFLAERFSLSFKEPNRMTSVVSSTVGAKSYRIRGNCITNNRLTAMANSSAPKVARSSLPFR
jgi:hypothetical protein